MTHTTFNEIESHLKHGLHVVVKDKHKDFTVFSPNKHEETGMRQSHFGNKNMAFKTMSLHPTAPKSDLDEEAKEHSWKIVNTFHTPAEPFEMGQEVEVIATGKILTISFSVDSFVYSVKESDVLFTHTELRPVLPTYEDDDATQDAIQLLKDNGYTITKEKPSYFSARNICHSEKNAMDYIANMTNNPEPTQSMRDELTHSIQIYQAYFAGLQYVDLPENVHDSANANIDNIPEQFQDFVLGTAIMRFSSNKEQKKFFMKQLNRTGHIMRGYFYKPKYA